MTDFDAVNELFEHRVRSLEDVPDEASPVPYCAVCEGRARLVSAQDSESLGFPHGWHHCDVGGTPLPHQPDHAVDVYWRVLWWR